MSDKSINHLTSKHGDALGIDNHLPPDPAQKSTGYKRIRTRINNENKEKFVDTVEEILKDLTTEICSNVSVCGIKDQGHYIADYEESGFFVGIHSEVKFAGQIKKAQPMNDKQLRVLRKENRVN